MFRHVLRIPREEDGGLLQSMILRAGCRGFRRGADMKTFAITARAAIAAMLLGGAVAAGDAAAQSGGHGGEYASSSRVAYNQPQDPRAARQPNLGGGFLELLITGRGPDATPAGGAVAGAAADPRRSTAGRAPAGSSPCARRNRLHGERNRKAPPVKSRARRRAIAPHQDVAPARVIPARQAALQIPRVRVRQRMVPSAVRSSPIAGPTVPGRSLSIPKAGISSSSSQTARRSVTVVGVGREGFSWRGTEKVTRKAEWPDWRPPESMRRRQPELPRFMPGGPENPLGARALYLGNTLYRIHGHQRAAYDRPGHVIRLHPDDERGCEGSLRTRAGRCQGGGAPRRETKSPDGDAKGPSRYVREGPLAFSDVSSRSFRVLRCRKEIVYPLSLSPWVTVLQPKGATCRACLHFGRSWPAFSFGSR